MASNRTAFGEKYKRASYHLSELSKIANEVWAESKVHSAAGSKNNNVNTSAHSAANITNMDNSADSSRSNSDSAANHGKVANIATNGFVQNLTNINSQVSQTIGRHSSDQQHRSSVSGDSSIGHRADATTISSSNNETVSATSDSSLRGKDLSSAATASSTAGRTATKGMTQEELDLIGFSSIANDKEAKQKAEEATQVKKPVMRERAVPSTQLGRLFGFGSLAARMALDVAMDSATSAFSGNSPERKSRLSDENAERLAEALCRMRGAALKLGQMLSLQDEASMPPALAKALDRVKQSADYMPKRQLEKQLTTQLGENWREKVAEFDPIPIAAASIGQVHRAKLHDGTEVAMKIQYPGVAESIDSDLRNLKALVSMTNMLPPGLFIDQIITVVSRELKEECKHKFKALFVLADFLSIVMQVIIGSKQIVR